MRNLRCVRKLVSTRLCVAAAVLSVSGATSAQLVDTASMPTRGAALVASSAGYEVTTSDGSITDWLGRGLAATEMSVLNHCVTGAVALGGNRAGHLRAHYNRTFSDYSRETNGRLSAGVSVLGLLGAKAQVEYFSRVASSDLATSVSLQFDSVLGKAMLDSPAYSRIGLDALRSPSDAWPRECGNSFVSAIHVGTRLYLGLVFHLATREERERFVRTIRVKALGMTISKKRFKEETSSFSQKGKLEIVAQQVGGKPQSLLTVWNQEQSLCSFQDPEPCLALWNALLEYATSPNGYRAQLTWPYQVADLAVLDFDTHRYSEGELDAPGFEQAPTPLGVGLAVDQLVALRYQVFSLLIRIQLVLASASDVARQATLRQLRDRAANELNSLDETIRSCQRRAIQPECVSALASAQTRFALLRANNLDF